MRKSHLITLIAGAFSVIVFSACTGNSRQASGTGKAFLENLYTCNFKACDALCTENGRKEVRWFASNLTEEDLSLISPDIKIEAEDCQITDTSAFIVYRAENVIVCDLLETKGHLGERTLTLSLRNRKGTWKVDGLKW